MKILLTGYKGNLGSAIQRHSKGEVVGIGRNGWEKLSDILLSGIDVVVHLADDLKNKIECVPTEIMSSRLLATTRLLETMKHSRKARLVFLSSCAVYGRAMDTVEEAECCPMTVNGMVKRLNERIIEEFCLKNDIKFEIYRVFNMYGDNDTFSILSKLKKCVETGTEFVYGDCHERDFIHVEDVAKIILKLMEMGHSYPYLNIGTGVATPIQRIVDVVKEKHPSLEVKNAFSVAIQYSCANITKLSSLIRYDFINVMDYVKNNF